MSYAVFDQNPPASQALLQHVVEQLPHGLCVFDGNDRLLLANPRYLQIWGLPAHLGRPGTAFADIMAATQGEETEASRMQPRPEPGTAGVRRREWRMQDGRTIAVTVSRRADGTCVALHEDITEQRHAEARIAHLAWHDALTGLPNRSRLRDELDRQLKRNARGDDLALLLLDLDHFKPVNDTLGHAAGDAVLQEVARRLRDGVRETDFVARLGGDEFAVLQCGPAQPAGSSALARRLIDAVCQPYQVAGHTLHVGASIGVAIAPFDGDDPDTLQKHADLALYRAKAEGRGTLRYFEPAMDEDARRRRDGEADLRRALDRGEFSLVYQPLVHLADGRITGFEALLRWQHPDRGLVSPADFIPLAEETGLIVPIGRWVLAQACREAASWAQPVRVSVNVSAVQFRKGALLADASHALRASGLAPSRLEIEITESVMLLDRAHALAVLSELRQQGVSVAMDDFGTGYSSLSLLRSFPFHRLKIDRSFVRDLAESLEARAIIRAVAQLGRSLGMDTTVEGVETHEQLAVVRAEGCVDGQGWLFSRPVAGSDVHALIGSRLMPEVVPS
jgi:diguanylate cyclase (GGDEF)-like protein